MDGSSITGQSFERAWVEVMETLQRNSINPHSYPRDALVATATARSWEVIGPAGIVDYLLYLASARPGPYVQQQWYLQEAATSSPISYSAGPAVAGPGRAADNGMPPASASPYAAAAASNGRRGVPSSSAPTADDRSPSNISSGRFSNPSVLGLSEGRKFPSRSNTMSSEATSISSGTPSSEAIWTPITTPSSIVTTPPSTTPYHGPVPNSPQACSICGDIFPTDSARFRHEDLVCRPMGGRPVADNVCSICGNVFTNVRNCRRHWRSVCTDEQISKCLTCGKSFARKYDMEAHAKREHK